MEILKVQVSSAAVAVDICHVWSYSVLQNKTLGQRQLQISKVCYGWCRQCFYGRDLFVI